MSLSPVLAASSSDSKERARIWRARPGESHNGLSTRRRMQVLCKQQPEGSQVISGITLCRLVQRDADAYGERCQ